MVPVVDLSRRGQRFASEFGKAAERIADIERQFPLLFGTARMSSRPEAGVVGPDFCVRGTDNLYVVDSSVFPTNLGVNPQLSIMAMARLAVERLAA